MSPEHRLALEWVMGPAFGRELCGALALRRIPDAAVRAEDAEEIRADTWLRFLELRAAAAADEEPGESLRRAVSFVVYHRYSREVRRRRAARRGALVVRDVEWPQEALAAEPPREPQRSEPGARRGRRRLAAWPLRGEVVGEARARVRRFLASLAERQWSGRGGGIAPEGAPGRGEPAAGALRWIREFEGDRAAGLLARSLVVEAGTQHFSEPAALLRAMRESSRWDGARAEDLARLAHAAVTTPPEDSW